MGLDMYLEKHTYLLDSDASLAITGKGTEHIKVERVNKIVERVGYWRKANAVHKWFVENVQDGKDDCGSYYVSREQIGELLDATRRVLASIEMVEADVTNDFRYVNGERQPILGRGKAIKDAAIAHDL